MRPTSAVESPRGELGVLHRVRRLVEAAPDARPCALSFVNLQSLPHLMKDSLIADTVAIISSVDPIMGEVDR